MLNKKKAVSIGIRCSNQVSCIQSGEFSQVNTVSHNTLWTVHCYYYVSEYQLPHAVDASHITPITRVNRSPKLLKLIGWRHCLCFMWSRAYPRPRPRLLALNQNLPQGSQVTCKKNRNITRLSVTPREPYSGTLFRFATYILGPPKIQTMSPPSIFSIPV